MTESKVFTDNFSRSFTEPGDFFQFLSDRKARSKWMTAPSRELQFEPVERGSTLGNLYMQIYDHNGAAEILEDTMENTSLLLKVDGKDYPVIIVPLLKEHYIMLRRNLLYTAVTRAKAKVILIGQKQAVFVAIHKCDVGQRNTVLADRIVAYYNRELSRRVA